MVQAVMLLRFYSPFWNDLLEALLPIPYTHTQALHYCTVALVFGT